MAEAKKPSDADKALHKPAQQQPAQKADVVARRETSASGSKPEQKSTENTSQQAKNTRTDDKKVEKFDEKSDKRYGYQPRIRPDDVDGPLELTPDGTEVKPQKVGGAAPGTKGEKAAAAAKEGSSVIEHKNKAPEVAVDPLSEIHDKEGGTSDETLLSPGEVEKEWPEAEKGEIEGAEVKKSDIPKTGIEHAEEVVEGKQKVLAQMQKTYTYGDQH